MKNGNKVRWLDGEQSRKNNALIKASDIDPNLSDAYLTFPNMAPLRGNALTLDKYTAGDTKNLNYQQMKPPALAQLPSRIMRRYSPGYPNQSSERSENPTFPDIEQKAKQGFDGLFEFDSARQVSNELKKDAIIASSDSVRFVSQQERIVETHPRERIKQTDSTSENTEVFSKSIETSSTAPRDLIAQTRAEKVLRDKINRSNAVKEPVVQEQPTKRTSLPPVEKTSAQSASSTVVTVKDIQTIREEVTIGDVLTKQQIIKTVNNDVDEKIHQAHRVIVNDSTKVVKDIISQLLDS
jgi:hypothetical protein